VSGAEEPASKFHEKSDASELLTLPIYCNKKYAIGKVYSLDNDLLMGVPSFIFPDKKFHL
jgi:hypothetical protein